MFTDRITKRQKIEIEYNITKQQLFDIRQRQEKQKKYFVCF